MFDILNNFLKFGLLSSFTLGTAYPLSFILQQNAVLFSFTLPHSTCLILSTLLISLWFNETFPKKLIFQPYPDGSLPLSCKRFADITITRISSVTSLACLIFFAPLFLSLASSHSYLMLILTANIYIVMCSSRAIFLCLSSSTTDTDRRSRFSFQLLLVLVYIALI